MVVPTVALFPLLWADRVGGMLSGLEHAAMLRACSARLLYRRSKYGP